MFKDYYSILGIPENVTPEQIKDAYRTQALKWHPDKNPDRDTTEQMKDINEAYSILSNADTRARYDKEYQFYQYANPKNSSKQTSASEDNDYDIVKLSCATVGVSVDECKKELGEYFDENGIKENIKSSSLADLN